ncbi:hypothetical protein [Actinoplanes sp. NPDC020271]|uniref:hypothetical protein n=1 Tax=Actinoplanes sp. NPDC020271 TaxID=3363896 RepID=UPI0037B341FD
MPTERWIAEHYPPAFMADMLADVVGDFTDIQLHSEIRAARDDGGQIATLAARLGAALNRLIQDRIVTVTVYADAYVITDRAGDQRGCLLGDFTVAQVADLLHLAPELIRDQRDTDAGFPDV